MKTEREILVAYAEDHSGFRKRIVQDIEHSGHIRVILVADEGASLLRQIAEGPVPDVCLIDISMPGMDGYDLLSEIKARYPQVRCLVLTMHQMAYHIQTMLRKGADGFLLKTAQPEEIILAINTVCSVGSYHSELPPNKELSNLQLNDREIELLKYLPTELTYMEIATAMNTSFKTICGIRDRLCAKLEVKARPGLIIAAIRLGYYTVNHKTEK